MVAWTSSAEGEAQTEFHKEVSKAQSELEKYLYSYQKGLFFYRSVRRRIT